MESDDPETVKRIKETVMDVLEEMDMAGMVRAAAAERLGMDLSVQHRKELVQSVIDLFLESLDCDEDEEVVVQEEVKEEEKQDLVQEREEKEMEVEKKEEGDKRVLANREYQCEDPETMKRIKETVSVILKGADMSSTTEAMVHAAVAERLGMDLSLQHRKKFVQSVINSFVNLLDDDEKEAGVVQEEVKEEDKQDQTREREEEEMEVEESDRRVLGKREYQRDNVETMKRIDGTVRDILKGADLYSMTDAMVHAAAAERLRMDLSLQHRKNFVQSVIDSFLDSLDSDGERAAVVQEEAREEEQDKAQEGRMRKRRRRRRSKWGGQSENTVTAVVAALVREVGREEEQDKAQEGRKRTRTRTRKRKRRPKRREQSENTVTAMVIQ